MPFKPFFALPLAFVLASCVSVTFTTTTTTNGTSTAPITARPWPASARCPAPASAPADAARLLALINGARRQAGLPAVALAGPANGVAHAYACEIAARRDISHIGSDGSNVVERLTRGGLRFGLAAENTAEGYTTPEAVMAAWMASPGHRRNILLAGVHQVGIGQTVGSFPTWVLDLYAPS